MKPHMNHLKYTMQRKQSVNEAGSLSDALYKYKNMVAVAQEHGHSRQDIINELELELWKINHDEREGDALFQQGVENAKSACRKAIIQIIDELKNA